MWTSEFMTIQLRQGYRATDSSGSGSESDDAEDVMPKRQLKHTELFLKLDKHVQETLKVPKDFDKVVEIPEQLTIDGTIFPKLLIGLMDNTQESYYKMYLEYCFSHTLLGKKYEKLKQLASEVVDISIQGPTSIPLFHNETKINVKAYLFHNLDLYIPEYRIDKRALFDELPYNQDKIPFALPKDKLSEIVFEFGPMHKVSDLVSSYIPQLKFYEITIDKPYSSTKVVRDVKVFEFLVQELGDFQTSEQSISDIRSLYISPSFSTWTLVYCYKRNGTLILSPYVKVWEHVQKHRVLCSQTEDDVVCAGHLTLHPRQNIIILDRLSGTFKPEKVSEFWLILKNLFPDNQFQYMPGEKFDKVAMADLPRGAHPDGPP
jgi:hypothetical protein